MNRSFILLPAVLLCGVSAVLFAPASAAILPAPAMTIDESGNQSVVLAGGCFWGMQEVFQHVKGVTNTVVGYTGGPADKAHYEMVSTGETGHAESVKITYDPSQVSFSQLMEIYFSIAHDPTELNHQGPDSGSQYRSEIFFTTPGQEKLADAYIAQLQAAKAFPNPIVTKVEPLDGFYAAEDYHQDYAKKNPGNMYLAINDDPKVIDLEKSFPSLYVKD
jgi:peptide-methionine (S)-S-oxide reductase